MKAYSTDLRERAVNSVESGECNIPEAARRYAVSEASLERWLAQQRATQSCAPRSHAGGVPRQLAAAEAVIRAAVKEHPDATLQELCDRVAKDCKIKSDPSMMCREVARLKLPLKKRRSMPASGIRQKSRSNGLNLRKP
jgi:transposase